MQSMMIFLLGCAAWTLAEYLLHRFLGHEWKFQNKFRIEHQKHHQKKNYFASNLDKLLVSMAAIFILGVFLLPIFGIYKSAYFIIGFLITYLAYEFFHRSLHVRAPKTKIGKALCRHHFYHHFGNGAMNHGVTTRFWDKVFKTYKEVDLVRIHQDYAMDWLCENGKIKSEFAKEYELVKSTPCI